jgi:hypothetical protein
MSARGDNHEDHEGHEEKKFFAFLAAFVVITFVIAI